MKLSNQLLNGFRKHKLPLTLGVIGGLFLITGFLIPSLNGRANGLIGNLLSEAVGIFMGSAITIAIIDELLARRDRLQRIHKVLTRVEGLLLDVAARALWGSQTYEPGELEGLSDEESHLESWRRILGLLAEANDWNSIRLGANEPAPDELTRMSPRIWDIIAVPPQNRTARKALVVSMCADDLEHIAREFIPELVEDIFEARKSSAVITHWVNVIRHTHLRSVAKDEQDHFFGHMAGAIWEVLVVLDEGFSAIPHPLRSHDDRGSIHDDST